MASVAALLGLAVAPQLIGGVVNLIGGGGSASRQQAPPPPPPPSFLDTLLSLLPYILLALGAVAAVFYFKK